MRWQQLHILVQQNDIEPIENALLALQSLSITHQDAGEQDLFQLTPQEECHWEHTKITALFSEDIDLNNVITTLTQQFKNLTYCSEQLTDQVWERIWLKDFKPMQFGDNTWICPTTVEPPQPNAITIFLDPGLAFGTGTHPTTALCLTWIDKEDLKNKIVIDYGCGSGILAIAALKHGAKHVVAVDHDPQALIATKENAQRNQIDFEKLSVYLPEKMPLVKNADIVMANILAQPLVELAKTFAHFLKPNGTIVLSGILREQEKMIIQAYEPFFKNFSIAQEEDWLRIVAKKS